MNSLQEEDENHSVRGLLSCFERQLIYQVWNCSSFFFVLLTAASHGASSFASKVLIFLDWWILSLRHSSKGVRISFQQPSFLQWTRPFHHLVLIEVCWLSPVGVFHVDVMHYICHRNKKVIYKECWTQSQVLKFVLIYVDYESNGHRQKFSLTPTNVTPEMTPSGSPKRPPLPTPPKGRSAAVSPKMQSTTGSPKWHSISDGRISLPSSLPTSKHSTAPNSPPHAGSHSGCVI